MAQQRMIAHIMLCIASQMQVKVLQASAHSQAGSAAWRQTSPSEAYLDVGIGVGASGVSNKHGIALREVAGILGSGLHLRAQDLHMSASFGCLQCVVPRA